MNSTERIEMVEQVLRDHYNSGYWGNLTDEQITLIKGNCNSVAYKVYDKIAEKYPELRDE